MKPSVHPLQQQFRYHCLDSLGRVRRGRIDAISQEGAVAALRGRNYRILDLQVKGSSLRRLVFPNLSGLGHIFEQLAMTVEAGIPLVEAVEYLAEEQTAAMRRYLRLCWTRLRGGESFAAALPLDQRPWHRAIGGVLQAGESSGQLATSLKLLGEAIGRDRQQKRQLTEALAYPCLLLTTLLVVVWILCSFAMPRYYQIFIDLGKAPPWTMQTIFWLGQLIAVAVPVLGVALLVLLLFHGYARRHPSGRWVSPAGLLTRIPGLGGVILEGEYGKLAFMLGMMQRSGVPVADALTHAQAMTMVPSLKADMEQAAARVQAGESLAEAVASGGHLPPLFLRCVRMGEVSGTLAEQMDNLNRFYFRQAEHRSKLFFALLQPLMILLVGGVVAAFVVAVFLPVIDLLGSF